MERGDGYGQAAAVLDPTRRPVETLVVERPLGEAPPSRGHTPAVTGTGLL